MPGDATILEGPVTPAPLFAYRALRSIFFTSPDSSPEYHNKDNIVPIYANSPTKSKVTLADAPRVTPPQKRKRDSSNVDAILSPTKGILRTPGLATPRAKYLKDINVKFKSVSPEVRRSEPVVGAESTSNAGFDDTTRAARPSSCSQPATPNSSQEQLVENMVQLSTSNAPTASRPCGLLPGALESYMAQTEKEMKRLIRYGKKMREYALKKDAENQELKIMIEELRQQNERLKNDISKPSIAKKDLFAALSHEQEDRNETQQCRLAQTQTRTSKAKDTITREISPALRTKNRGHVREEVDRVETTVRVQTMKNSPARGRSPSLALKPVTSFSQTTSGLHRRCSSPAKIVISVKPSNGAAPQRTGPATSSVPASTTSVGFGPSNSGTLRLPPDRAAAARERLRRRAEARKASADTDALTDTNTARDTGAAKDPVPQQKQPIGRAKEIDPMTGTDEPSFDWANLDV
ncbi:hypothetical protein A1O7_02897 [Cladophialophora yegresii CBS 114405]|uniref:Spindle pole body-associated protein cut12 domain-containing protein n=1 Tax=Cladophialophora yegresii CBS 114405 TaxID=1182544 RepID=W9WBV1_9EURO|nr:uncharacterized protein A1O7_02897 [Cladophialophora yegresii CBS 114405]EXJ62460.1 hypothetical protein A1O7_02897 [Cladophialophora yegresii CBS 114405]